MSEYFKSPRYFEEMAAKTAEIMGQGNRPILQAAAETIGKVGEKKAETKAAKAKYETELQDERKNMELKEVFEGLSSGDYARKQVPHPTEKDDKGQPKLIEMDFDYVSPMNSVYKLSPSEKAARSGNRNQYSPVDSLYRVHAQNIINAAFKEYNDANIDNQKQPLIVGEDVSFATLREVLSHYDYMPKIAELNKKIAEQFPTESKKTSAEDAIKDVTTGAVAAAKDVKPAQAAPKKAPVATGSPKVLTSEEIKAKYPDWKDIVNLKEKHPKFKALMKDAGKEVK